MVQVASTPSMPGSPISITTRDGRKRRAREMASGPVAAIPTTWNRGVILQEPGEGVGDDTVIVDKQNAEGSHRLASYPPHLTLYYGTRDWGPGTGNYLGRITVLFLVPSPQSLVPLSFTEHYSSRSRNNFLLSSVGMGPSRHFIPTSASSRRWNWYRGPQSAQAATCASISRYLVSSISPSRNCHTNCRICSQSSSVICRHSPPEVWRPGRNAPASHTPTT